MSSTGEVRSLGQPHAQASLSTSGPSTSSQRASGQLTRNMFVSEQVLVEAGFEVARAQIGRAHV